MGTQLASLFAFVARVYIVIPYVINKRGVGCAPGFCKLAVEMQYLRTSCPFVQIVDILRYYMDIKMFLQLRQSCMTRVWFASRKLSSSLVVETENKLLVLPPSHRRCHLCNVILFP